mmetsp:Transcript_13964/g.19022  ORF Transcript_13964/g.19022 Transcript_13964/m.19022 type:complete len:98 (-) Transcript_13964:692-985(-)
MLQSLEEELTRVLCSDAACSRLHSFRLRFSLYFGFHSMLANIMTNVHVCCVTGDIRHFKSRCSCILGMSSPFGRPKPSAVADLFCILRGVVRQGYML